MVNFLPVDAIEIRERQRSLDANHVAALRDSILSKGLLHAPVIALDPLTRTPFLVAGAHRLEAIRQLHNSAAAFLYNGVLVPSSQSPITHVTDLSPADLLETELHENIIRHDLSWQDKARALAAIHAMRVQENPAHTYMNTAKELAAKGARANERDPIQTIRKDVRNATILAENLHRPSVMHARNATEALGILYKEEIAKVESEVIRRRQSASTFAPPEVRAVHGDMTLILPTLDAETVDLILADPPYGIGVDTGGFRSRTVEHHNYVDTQEVAKAVLQTILTEGFRVCKQRANLFIFGDVDLFPYFKQACLAMGWKPFRTPIIWQKSESEGLAPWGGEGFRRTYEMIFFATKGGRGLLQSPVDILSERRVGRAVRRYGPEKPVGLMKQLIECSTMPGDFVLDPCCGAGSTLIAARHLKRKALGIELDLGAYNMAVVAADHDPTETVEQEKTEALA